LIATKFPATLWATADDMPGQLADSLARLRRDHVDVYQHHFPFRWVDIPRLMDFLADGVAAGKVRAVGVSNYSADQMRRAHAALAQRGIPLASNQVEYSLLHRRPERNGVLDTCRELDVTLIAYQPLTSGALTGRYTPTNRRRGLRRFFKPFRGRGLATLEPITTLLWEIGKRYGKTPAQVALRWLIENDMVLPIPGAKNRKQATENAGALTFHLTPDEIGALETATRALRLTAGAYADCFVMVGRSRLTKRRKAIGEAVVDDLIRAGQLPGDETHLGSAAAGAQRLGGGGSVHVRRDAKATSAPATCLGIITSGQ
jgi:aryl-alcohol dehydrogenase-like predicted oxidoreductase